MSEQKDSSLSARSSEQFISQMEADPERGQYRRLLKSLCVIAIVSYVKVELVAVNMDLIPTLVIMTLVGFGAFALLSTAIRIGSSLYGRKSNRSSRT